MCHAAPLIGNVAPELVAKALAQLIFAMRSIAMPCSFLDTHKSSKFGHNEAKEGERMLRDRPSGELRDRLPLSCHRK